MLDEIQNYYKKEDFFLNRHENLPSADKKAIKRRKETIKQLEKFIQDLQQDKLAKSDFLIYALEMRFKCLAKARNKNLVENFFDPSFDASKPSIWREYYELLNLLIYQAIYTFKQQGGSQYFLVGFFKETNYKKALELLQLSKPLLRELTKDQSAFVKSMSGNASTGHEAITEYEQYEAYLKNDPSILGSLDTAKNPFLELLEESLFIQQKWILNFKKIFEIQVSYYEDGISKAQDFAKSLGLEEMFNYAVNFGRGTTVFTEHQKTAASLNFDELKLVIGFLKELLRSRSLSIELDSQIFINIIEVPELDLKKFRLDSYQAMSRCIHYLLLILKEKYGDDFNHLMREGEYQETWYLICLSALTLKDFYYGITDDAGTSHDAIKSDERTYQPKWFSIEDLSQPGLKKLRELKDELFLKQPFDIRLVREYSLKKEDEQSDLDSFNKEEEKEVFQQEEQQEESKSSSKSSSYFSQGFNLKEQNRQTPVKKQGGNLNHKQRTWCRELFSHQLKQASFIEFTSIWKTWNGDRSVRKSPSGSSHCGLFNAKGKRVGTIYSHGNSQKYGPSFQRHLIEYLKTVGITENYFEI